MKNTYTLITTLIVSLFNSILSYAQCDTVALAHDSLQWAFVGSYNPMGTNYSQGQMDMVRHNDTLYFGGSFGYVGKTTSRFAVLNQSTGDLVNYATWAKANGDVYCSAPDGSGGWVIGGKFTKVGDSVRIGFAHINSSGQVSAIKANINAVTSYYAVNGVVVHNGIVYIGGFFTTVNGTSRSNLAALNISTGILSTTWNAGANSIVHTMTTDGTDIYLGGYFTTLGSSGRNRIGAINISTGNVTSWNPGANNGVMSILINNNKVYVGGLFTQAGGASRNYMAAIDKTTGNATSFNPNIGGFPSYGVSGITLLGSRVYAVGDFLTAQSQNRNGAAAFDTLTGTVTTWNPNANGYSYAIDNNGSKILLGGDFTRIGSTLKVRVALIDTGTANLNSFDAGLDSFHISPVSIRTVRAFNSNIYIGGDISGIKGGFRSGLAAIDIKNNILLSTFKPDLDYSTFTKAFDVSTMKIDNGLLYIGGKFDKVNGVSRNYVASFDINSNYALTSWNPLNVSGNFIQVIKIETLGTYAYIGGYFDFVSNGNHRSIVRVNKTTGVIDTWTPTVNNNNSPYVADIKIANNKVYFSGRLHNSSFAIYGMQYYDLSNSTEYFYNFNGAVHQVHVSGNKVFASGFFSQCNSTNRSNFAALDITTNQLLSWNPNTYITMKPSLVPYKNKLLIGGNYVAVGGQTRNYIAMVDTINGTVSPGWHPNANYFVNKAYYTGDTLILTGEFLQTDMGSSGVRNIFSYARFQMGNYVTPSVSITTAKDTVCAGTNVTVNATTAVTGATYQWKKNGVTQTGSSSAFSFTPGNNDTIKCIINIPSTGCYLDLNAMSNEIIFKVNATIPATASVSASANNVCAGVKVNYNVNTNIPGAYYKWKVGTTVVGANTDTFSYIPANGDIVSCTVTRDTGTCFTPSPITDDTTMIVLPYVTPSILIMALPDTNICAGTPLTFSSNSTNSGTSPGYQWYKNGTLISGATLSAYAATGVQNNDAFTCVITSNASCLNKTKDTANIITIHVTPVTAPTVSISANPGTSIQQGTMVTFTATAGNIGTSTSYQWRINGANISGAVTNSYMSNSLADNDQVSVVVYSNDSCSNPDTALSNILLMSVSSSVSSLNKNPEQIRLAPNPTRNIITINSSTLVQKAEVSDLLGRRLILQTGNINKMDVNLDEFSPGIYIIKVNDSYIERVIKE